jgi:transcriptional regulator with XRE-family HTH domain
MAEQALRPGEIFGRRVRESRAALGWTQQQLADRLTEIGRKTDRATIARTEKGQTLAALDMVIAIAAALHVPPVHLLVPLDDDETVALTPKLPVDAPAARAWIRGRGLLPGEDLLDIWPHLPESEKRAAVTATSPGASQVALILGGWFEDENIAARVAAHDEATATRKEKKK